MSEQLIQAIGECGAIIGGHFVLSSGRHSESIVDAKAVVANADSKLVGWITGEMLSGINSEINTVVGVASTGNDLAGWCVEMLRGICPSPRAIHVVTKKTDDGYFDWTEPIKDMSALYNKRVLVVEDVVTTGGTVSKAINLVRSKGGSVVGVAALCSHGGVDAKRLNVPEFHAAVEIPMITHAPVLCPLCKEFGYESVRTDYGHGAEFLEDLRRKGMIPA